MSEELGQELNCNTAYKATICSTFTVTSHEQSVNTIVLLLLLLLLCITV